jgi:transcriptional regulator with XRE-family HTH domain
MKDGNAVLERLFKEDPAAYRRAHFLDALRVGLRNLRGEASQKSIAERMETDQSEVSRLENSISNYTRIGTLLDYLEACGATVEITVHDAAGKCRLEVNTASSDKDERMAAQ